VLKLPEELPRQNPQALVAEEPRVVLDVHYAADTRDRERILLVFEGVAEAARHLAHLFLGTPALHQGGLVDHERRRLVLPGKLVYSPCGSLQPRFVVFQVSYLPGGLDGPICYLNHRFSPHLGRTL
jgi:hypothetical protein